MRRSLALALMAAALAAGCLQGMDLPGAPPAQPGCTEARPVEVAVEVAGGPSALREAQLRTRSAMEPDPATTLRAMTACDGPRPRQALAATSPTGAEGVVDAQQYQEVRLVFEDHVVRLRADIPMDEPGTLALGLDGAPRATWNGQELPLLAVERLEGADALAPFVLERRGLSLEERVFVFDAPVRSASNWGLGVAVRLVDAEGLAGVDSTRLDGVGGEVEILRPDGSVAARGSMNALHEMRASAEPDAPGAWSLRVSLRDPPADGGTWSIEASLEY